uniref:Beta-2-microglobulin n=1 Tax=Pogona vitticeps TaxID=103695 RepID=A0A6J0UZK5_9SAUR
MASYLTWVVFAICITALKAVIREPDIQVYTRFPVEFGKTNTLNCYVERFHPPKIDITLLKDNVPIENVKKSDLSFDRDWTFHLLVSAEFVPEQNSVYTCKVEHDSLQQAKIVKLDY